MEYQMDRRLGQGILKLSRLVSKMKNDFGYDHTILLGTYERRLGTIYEQVDEIIHKGSYNEQEKKFLNQLRKVVIQYKDE